MSKDLGATFLQEKKQRKKLLRLKRLVKKDQIARKAQVEKKDLMGRS